MSSITLYPSNWLYNAGVIGLLRVLESAGKSVQSFIPSEGIIDLPDSLVENALQEPAKDLPEPLNNLRVWHWHYVQTSFEWNYGTIADFILNTLRRGEKATNRRQVKGQLECKNFKYESEEIDFRDINERISEIWGKTFGRSAELSIDTAKDEIVKAIDSRKDAYIYRKAVGYLFSQGGFYQNFYNPSQFGDLKKFIELFTKEEIFKNSVSTSTSICSFCSEAKFEVEPVNATQMSFLFPVFSQFPNAYWQNNEEAVTQICSLCKFIVIHHHLAFTRLSDGSEIFINAPSFKVMYYLNKFVREVFGALSAEEMHSKRNILAMSMIEYATKVQATLGVWTGMNIEVVSRRGSQIEFFSLPYKVVQLLSDRRIAGLLSQIGEFSILNRVLAQDFSRLMETGYRLLRIGLKAYGERGKSENDFINQTLRLEKNRRNPTRVAEQIFQLCALIEEKQNRRKAYEYIYGS
jgi:CRISPR-associated protein Cst1